MPRPHRHTLRRRGLGPLGLVVLMLCCAVGALVPGRLAAQGADFATLVADRLFLDGPERLIAEGNVEALFGTTRLQARRVVYDRGTDALRIEGPIVLNEGEEIVILAEAAEMSASLRRGLIRSARVVIDQQLQIAAHSVERRDERFTEMNAVVASSCEICANRPTPLWEIRARRVVHDEAEQQVYFDNAQFRLFGLPVAYVPRLRVPDPRLERATGWLAPRLSFDTGHGVGLRAPYFIVLGPDRDLTLTPYLASKGTRALDLRYRQAFASGMLEFGGLIARDQIRPGRTRGVAYLEGDFALGRGYRLSFNLIQPSDREVLEDYNRGVSRLTSDITLERIQRDTRARVQLLQFRSLRLDDDNRILPNRVGQAVFERRMDVPGIGGVAAFRLEAHLHQRRRAMGAMGLPAPTPDRADGPRPREMSRLSLDLGWRRDAVLPMGVLGAVGLDLGVDHFRLSDTGGVFPRSATRVSPQMMAELRWPLVRNTGNGVSHVIEPVAQVVWGRNRLLDLPHEESRMPELDGGNLFATNRFASREMREGGLRANLGVSWTRHAPEGWSSTLTLGRVWRERDLEQFSDATPLSGGQSDWLVGVSLGTEDGLLLSNRMLITSDLRVQRTALELDWVAEDYTISTSYMRIIGNPFEARARTASEWSFEGTRDIDEFWTARVGWRYDIAQRRAARAMVGLEYENECLRMAMGVERRFASISSPRAQTSLGLNIDILGIGGNPSRNRRACSEM